MTGREGTRGEGKGRPGRAGRHGRGAGRHGRAGRAGPSARDSRAGPSARALAGGIVRGVLAGRGAARTHVERAGERAQLEGRDAALLTELVYGTVRRLGSVDLLLACCARGGLARIEEDVLAHLRVATYQLLFLDHVPAPVAVSEGVVAVGRPSARGFANAVLRAVSRLVVGRHPADEPPAGVPWTRLMPGREQGWVELAQPLLPDPQADPGGWLAVAAALPPRHAGALVERLGLPGALEVARAHDAPPPVFLRVNLLRGTREDLLARLAAAGLAAAPGALPESIRLGVALGEGAWAPLWAGVASVQDETAMAVARLVQPRPGERVVDLCAAPGGKSTHLAELMQDQGQVDALDVEPARVRKVSEAARRLRLGCVRAALVDPEDPRPPEGPPIDRVLADVPCSNTGVLRRRVELRHRLDQLDPAPLLALQARLLRRALELVRPGGVVVYSTCSIEPAENEEQVRAVLRERPALRLEEELTSLPRRQGGDGGYAARLRVPG